MRARGYRRCVTWPSTAESLDREQRRLAAVRPAAWRPAGTVVVAGCFLAFARGQQGPGAAGDGGWAAAVSVAGGCGANVASFCVRAIAGAAYDPGRLALREGAALETAVVGLHPRPDVVIIDATGRDHPRGAGLALHVGAVLDIPTIGVTHRPLAASGPPPGPERGARQDVLLDGRVVGAWLRTVSGVRPVLVHAGWRTDPDTAVEVAMLCAGPARTPEPLRRARVLARTSRAHAEGRTSQQWVDPLIGFPGA